MESISLFFDTIIKAIGSIYPESIKIYDIVGTVISILLAYKALYIAIGMFFTRIFPPAKKNHKYGIVIAARNEEKVIGNLLDSISKQDYPKELLTVFVVADNCTDNTAIVASKKGAIVYERHDEIHKTKGYALQYLFKKIAKDYGTNTFEGYFVFDADNLLKQDYISKMNNAFDSGEKIITSYRNTKNFDENWLASTYAIHWIRSIRMNHRARSVLRLATNIQGTGFLFSNEIVRDGWKYTSLTEDRALTADAVAQGYQITYQDEAEFFDEQPVNLKVALRQRLRWSKGHLQAFAESGPYLFINIFLGKKYLKTKWQKNTPEKNTSLPERIKESIRHRFASYDTLMQLTPIAFINLCKWLLVAVIIYSCMCYTNGINNLNIIDENIFIGSIIGKFFNYQINLNPGIKTLFISILIAIWTRILYRIGVYLSNMILAIYIFIVEKRRIKKISLSKKILYTITWPIFDIIGRYTTYIALFVKVTWKPIPHESKLTIDDLNRVEK